MNRVDTRTDSLVRVPNQPKTPHRGIRVADDLWHEFGQAVARIGSDRTKVIVALIKWYVGRGDLPERPRN